MSKTLVLITDEPETKKANGNPAFFESVGTRERSPAGERAPSRSVSPVDRVSELRYRMIRQIQAEKVLRQSPCHSLRRRFGSKTLFLFLLLVALKLVDEAGDIFHHERARDATGCTV